MVHLLYNQNQATIYRFTPTQFFTTDGMQTEPRSQAKGSTQLQPNVSKPVSDLHVGNIHVYMYI